MSSRGRHRFRAWVDSRSDLGANPGATWERPGSDPRSVLGVGALKRRGGDPMSEPGPIGSGERPRERPKERPRRHAGATQERPRSVSGVGALGATRGATLRSGPIGSGEPPGNDPWSDPGTAKERDREDPGAKSDTGSRPMSTTLGRIGPILGELGQPILDDFGLARGLPTFCESGRILREFWCWQRQARRLGRERAPRAGGGARGLWGAWPTCDHCWRMPARIGQRVVNVDPFGSNLVSFWPRHFCSSPMGWRVLKGGP